MSDEKEIRACKVAEGGESPKGYNKVIYFNLMISDKACPDTKTFPLVKVVGKTFKDIENLLCWNAKECLKRYRELGP